MFEINIRADFKAGTDALDALELKQLPFAMAQAVTGTARQVARVERDRFASFFDAPTPFTLNAMGVIPARKYAPTATVFVKDIQAAYLLPYEQGGAQPLGAKQAILTPRDIALNAYGNLPRGKIASLKGRPDLFIGEVKTRDGRTIGGVWQRVNVTRRGMRRRGRQQRGRIFSPTQGRLKLLVQFTRPAQVTHQLNYRETALAAAKRFAPLEFDRAMATALATTR